MESKCHICESITDFTCDECGEPVCEDCCVQMTIHNQIDYPLCTYCQERRYADDHAERSREWARQEEENKKKAEESAKRKANYWKPENVVKRRAAKDKKKEKQRERDRQMVAAAAKWIGEAFRGMF